MIRPVGCSRCAGPWTWRCGRAAGYGREAVTPLIEFRTLLGWPDHWVRQADALAVTRYRDPGEILAGLATSAGAGYLELAPDGAFRAVGAGMEFLREQWRLHDSSTTTLWADRPGQVARLADALRPVLAAARGVVIDGGSAWAATAPVCEPAEVGAGALLLNRLGTLRYDRADAHAAAGRLAGLTPVELAAISAGPAREAIEVRTNQLAAAAWRGLPPAGRAGVLADLRQLPGLDDVLPQRV